MKLKDLKLQIANLKSEKPREPIRYFHDTAEGAGTYPPATGQSFAGPVQSPGRATVADFAMQRTQPTPPLAANSPRLAAFRCQGCLKPHANQQHLNHHMSQNKECVILVEELRAKAEELAQKHRNHQPGSMPVEFAGERCEFCHREYVSVEAHMDSKTGEWCRAAERRRMNGSPLRPVHVQGTQLTDQQITNIWDHD